MKKSTKSKLKKLGSSAIEIIVLGAICLTFAIGFASNQNKDNKTHMTDGGKQLSDEERAGLINNQGNDTVKITYLEFDPGIVEINPGQTKVVDLKIRPDISQLWQGLRFENSKDTVASHTFAYSTESENQKVNIVGKEEGITTLKVYAKDGGGASGSLTIKVGWKLDIENIKINTSTDTPKSSEPFDVELVLVDTNATLKNKEITWSFEDVETELFKSAASPGRRSGNLVNSLSSKISDATINGKFNEILNLEPKQGGILRVNAHVYDPVYNMHYDITKDITIEQQWKPTTSTPTGCDNEKDASQYRSYDYQVYSNLYMDKLNKVGEEGYQVGFRYPINGWNTEMLLANPAPRDPGVKAVKQYNKLSISSWNAWTRGTTTSRGAEKGTEYCYKTRGRESYTYGCNVYLGTVGNSWGYPACSGGWGGQWWDCWNGCNPDVNWGCAGGCTFYRSDCTEYRGNGCSGTRWGGWSGETGCRQATSYGYVSCSSPGESSSCQTNYASYRTPNLKTTPTWVDCPNGVCPTDNALAFYDIRTVYYAPISVVWTEWGDIKIEKTSTRNVETRASFKCPINYK